jgi:DNA repair exonuclease SbcCD nuclease subunit
MFRFIHTADWQIGNRAFAFADAERAPLLRQARVGVLDRIGETATVQDALCVLVAGDVFDAEDLSNQTLLAPLERMARFPRVHWYLLPGNHDPDRPERLWDRLARLGLPQNVHPVRVAEPVRLADNAYLLPAPLGARAYSDDPTAWMDSASTPADALRIGLAHGSIRDFGDASAETALREAIAPDRARRSGLDYLALGDWHRVRRIDARTWYSGTPEPDAFYPPGEPDSGEVLAVTLTAPGGEPRVEPIRTGRYRWLQLAAALHSGDDIDALIAQARSLDSDPGRVFLRLRVDGALSLAERARFTADVEERLAAALFGVDIDDANLLPEPSADDLDAIDREGGMVRAVAEALVQQIDAGSGEEAAAARQALALLYDFARREGGSA